MRSEDRHTETPELVEVDLVAAAAGQGLDETDHLDAGLDRVVAGDQADVAPPDDEQSLGGPDEVAVQKRLERAGAVDPRQVASGKGEVLLPRAARDENRTRLHLEIVAPLLETDLLVVKRPHGGRSEHDRDGGESFELMRENAGDLDAPGARVAIVAGAEEGVRLQRELPAELVLVVHDESLRAEKPELDRGVDAGRPAPDDENVGLDRWNLPEPRQRVVRRKRGAPIAAPHLHPGPDRRHASLDRKTVDEHGALAALPIRAEDALGATVPRMVAEYLHAAREERRRDDFALVRLNLSVVEGEGNFRTLHDRKNRVRSHAEFTRRSHFRFVLRARHSLRLRYSSSLDAARVMRSLTATGDCFHEQPGFTS